MDVFPLYTRSTHILIPAWVSVKSCHKEDLKSLCCRLSVCLSVCIEASIVTTSPFLFPESELVTEPEEEGEEEEEKDTKEAEKEEEGRVHCPSLADSKPSLFDNWLLVLNKLKNLKLKSFGPDFVLSIQPWQRQSWRRWLCMRLKTTKCFSSLKRRSHQNHTRLKKKNSNGKD